MLVLPKKDSRAWRILLALLGKPMTMHQGIEVHGLFATAAVPGGVPPEKILELYCNLIDRGCLVKIGAKYKVTEAAQAKIERLMGRGHQEVVRSPYRNPWTREATAESIRRKSCRHISL